MIPGPILEGVLLGISIAYFTEKIKDLIITIRLINKNERKEVHRDE